MNINFYNFVVDWLDTYGTSEDSSEAVINLARQFPWWRGWAPNPYENINNWSEGVQYSTAPWSPNAGVAVEDFVFDPTSVDFGENEAEYGSGAGNASCPFVGCTDSDAENYNPLAVEDCRIPAEERGRLLPSGLRDLTDGEEIIDFGCLGDIGVNVAYCIDPVYQNCPGYQQTNIGAIGDFAGIDLGIDPLSNTYIVTTQEELNYLTFSINNTTNSAGCSYVVQNQIDLSLDSTPCGCNIIPGDGGGPEDYLEPQVAYTYWDGCCQYICKGEYTLDADGNPTNIENWTEDFAQDGGVPACRNFLYIAEEYLGEPNPDHDYNPNVSGTQQPE